MKGLAVFLFLSLFLFTGITYGATFDVSTPRELQDALTQAQANGEDDVINVAPGDYYPRSPFKYETPDGDGGHTLVIQAQNPANPPVLNGWYFYSQIMNIDTDTDNDGGDTNGDVTVTGLVFQSGRAAGDGGGLYFKGKSASLTITDCTFTDNTGDNGGGVKAYSYSGIITIIDNYFSDNHARWSGGAVEAGSHSGDVIITGNTFINNIADSNGGGTWTGSHSGDVTLTENTFSGNNAYWGGGAGGYSYSGNIVFTNNIFSDNTAKYGGGLYVYIYTGDGTITNNTLSNNTADFTGGGAWLGLHHDTARFRVYNTILWNNVADMAGDDGDDLYVESDGNNNSTGANVEIYNNDFSCNDFDGISACLFITDTDNYTHNDNISASPLFVDAINGDFHLKSSSPCIDAGDNNAPELPATDFDGESRIMNGIVDIGADEYTAVTPPLPDIKANGSDGPVNLVHGDGLSVTVALDPGSMAGNNADWWVVVNTPLGWYHYDALFDLWLPSIAVSYQGPLFTLSPYEVLNTTAGPQILINTQALPSGTYRFYFGVDMNMDGAINLGYYDSVEVNIGP